MSDSPKPQKQKLLALLALVLLGVVALGVLVWLGVDVKGLIVRAFALLSDAGPVVFFAAMALLPCFAFPMMFFALSAGPAFGERLGMPLVLALCLGCVTFNLFITYWLARKSLRPLLTHLLQRLGYKLPEVDSTDATDLLIILRVTPGVPFFAQNYLSGLANIPFVRYMLLSCLISWTYNGAFVLFGDALLHGHGRMAILAFGGILAVVAATHLVRRHYAGRKASA